MKNNIRPLASLKQMIQALTLIQKPPTKLPKDYQENKKNILDIVGDGSLYSNARLIRDLHARNFDKPLHINESHIYEKIREQYINEWAISANMSKAEAGEKLNHALLESIRRI